MKPQDPAANPGTELRPDERESKVGDLGRGNERGRVFGAGENEIAVNLVGHQDQFVLGAESTVATISSNGLRCAVCTW